MSNGDLNWIANFIWGIADDVLRDLYVRGKYRDVILPMMVLRRLDAVLEPTKKAGNGNDICREQFGSAA
jgi:type I restriction enzyme M protein